MASYRTNRLFLSFKNYLICIAIFIYVCTTGSGSFASFEDFHISTLQSLIYQSRHFPVCVILRSEGSSTKLESRLLKFRTTKDPESNLSSWKIGRFSVDQVTDPPVKLPELLPTLRCYLGFAVPFDFKGKASVKHLQRWFNQLTEKHAEQLEEATPARVDETVNQPGLTLIGFSGYQKHYEVEELLLEVRDKWKEQLNVLFVHPHSQDVRFLADKYKIRSFPSAVLVENSASTDWSPVIRQTFSPGQMTRQHLHLYLTARSFPALKLTVSNFEDVVLDLTKYYVPIVVCFYLETSQHALQHLYALQRTIDSFHDNKIDIRFGLVEVNFDTRLIMEKWVTFGYTTKFPFTVLFHPQWQNGAVVDIQQTLLTDRPTVSLVSQALRSQSLPLKTKEGATVDFQPWGRADPSQVSQLFEGPHGLMCSTNAHNETENIPRCHSLRQTKKKHQIKAHKDTPTRKIGAWHQQFDSASIDSKLHRVGTLPVITEDSWAGVIKKSHAPNHPFYPGNRWRGELTKVALIIFIIADCGSCQRNMAMFEELHKTVTTIDGSSLYLVNCTSDPRLCERLGVRGFPSVCAFRGLGWLHGDRCLSSEAGLRVEPVKMDYHGVVQVAPIMEWFSGVAAAEAVKNVRFEPLSNDTKVEDVRLVATLTPRASRYLPHVSKAVMADYFYPYECLRLACERLYGQAACYVQYSKDIPRSEFSNEDQDMIISKVSLHRRDGLSATVARLGRTLSSVLEEEADSSIHVLHHPHRYDLPPDMKCETDHAACTDLIVQLTTDHARLPITHMSSASFHMSNSLVFQGELPVLVTLAHQDNITADSDFYMTLQKVARDLYNDIVVVTVDVDQYTAWSGQFVPRNYAAEVHVKREFPSLYVYPRFCIVNWTDHHHAAFHPPISNPTRNHPFTEASITQFVKRVLLEPQQNMVETEHF